MSEYTTANIRDAWVEYNIDEPTAGEYIPMTIAEASDVFDAWIAEHDRLVAERAWEEGRDAVIRYSLKHVENEPEEIAGYIDQHIVGIGGSKLDNPYRKEQENNNA